jgi:hypothetical protein
MDLYFIYTADHNLVDFYRTKEEFGKALEAFDFLGLFHDDGWDDEVRNCFAGHITGNFKLNNDNLSDDLEPYKTHHVVEIDRIEQPDDIDENGFSPSQQRYWGEWSYICMFGWQPVTKSLPSHPVDAALAVLRSAGVTADQIDEEQVGIARAICNAPAEE